MLVKHALQSMRTYGEQWGPSMGVKQPQQEGLHVKGGHQRGARHKRRAYRSKGAVNGSSSSSAEAAASWKPCTCVGTGGGLFSLWLVVTTRSTLAGKLEGPRNCAPWV